MIKPMVFKLSKGLSKEIVEGRKTSPNTNCAGSCVKMTDETGQEDDKVDDIEVIEEDAKDCKV